MKTKFFNQKLFAIYKNAIFSLLVDPLFYFSSIVTILFCSFRFFFEGRFFIENIGISDLRLFFQSVPYISILTIPLIIFRLKNLIFDDSLPVSPIVRFFSVISASFSAFAFPLILLITIPFCVNLFGDVDFGQAISGFCGIFLYGICAISLCTFLFALLNFSPAVPLLLSMLILAIVDFIHLLPLYLKINSFLTFFLQKLSFAWHFSSFEKGILDSRDIVFYFLASFCLILFAVFVEYKRTERKFSKLSVTFFSLIFIFLGISSENIYFRFDATNSKAFSISQTSRNLAKNLDSPLRITYYRSKELKDLYPQSLDVAEFLQEFASVSKNISISIENADSEHLSKLKIQGRQFQSNSGNKMEFVTVYSAVVLQYLEKQSIIPFVLSTQTLEYDLAQRIQQLVTENYRRLLVVVGNGRSIENSYNYVVPLLSSYGFMPEIAGLDENLSSKINSLTINDELFILGSSSLNSEEAESISQAFKRGVPSFIATSPYNIPIEEEWNITKNNDDKLIPILNNLGFAIGNSLVEDLSCFPLKMQSVEENAEYVIVNYPLWISVLPQENVKLGCTFFWASPLRLYNNTKPLIKTTNLAWIQRETENESKLFLTDPFNIPKTAKSSDAENSQFVLAATNGKITVVSDQYFVDSMLTNFISNEDSLDLRNFNFLSSQLLKLRGDEKIADLMEKAKKVSTLYKITNPNDFINEKIKTVILNFVALPLIFISLFLFVLIKRLQNKKRNV